MEESKKINKLVKSSLLQIKSLGMQAVSLARTKARSLQPGGPRPRARKALKRRPVKRKPRRALVTPRKGRNPRRRKRMTYII